MLFIHETNISQSGGFSQFYFHKADKTATESSYKTLSLLKCVFYFKECSQTL